MVFCVVCDVNIPMKLHLKIVDPDFNEKFKYKEIKCYRSFEAWPQYCHHLFNVYRCPVSYTRVEVSENSSPNFDSSVSNFAGKMYANLRMPRFHLQNMFEEVTDLVKFIMFEILQPLIEQNIMNPERSLSLNDIFYIVLELLEMQFGTEYRQFKSFQNKYHFIKVRDYFIGDKLKNILVQDRII